MLTKEQLIQASDNLIKLYEKIEDDLLINVTRRFDVKKDIKDIEKWQTEKLSQLGALKNENIKTIAKSLNITAKEIESALTETGYKTLETDEVIYERALGLGILSEAPIPIEASPMLKQILKGAISNTRTFMNMINTTALQSANEAFLNIINQTYLETSLGIYDYNTSMRKAVRQLADEGIKGASYISAKGKKTYAQMDVAVRRCIVTSCSQTAGNMQLQRAKDWGCNLVEVSSHVGSRPSHAVWQGKIYMLEGSSPEYPNFYVTTQYGTVTGLKGANCSHDFYPFFEGISNRTYYPVDEKENKRIYEESQEQRRLEREIRKEKRKILTAREVGDNEFLKESQLRLKAKEKELNKFINDTARTKRANRQQVMDFGHSESMKAVWANKKEIAKYSQYHYNKDGTIKATDDLTNDEHPYLPDKYKSYAVVDTVSGKNKQRNRMIYDAEGKQKTHINSGPHNSLKHHPYGIHGEHAHDIIWDDNKIVERTIRDITEQERKEHKDIL